MTKGFSATENYEEGLHKRLQEMKRLSFRIISTFVKAGRGGWGAGGVADDRTASGLCGAVKVAVRTKVDWVGQELERESVGLAYR